MHRNQTLEGFYETLQATDKSCIRRRENLHTNSGKSLSQTSQRDCESPPLAVLSSQLPKTPDKLIRVGVSPGLHRRLGPDHSQAYYPAYVIL